jgi:hypothetical protein
LPPPFQEQMFYTISGKRPQAYPPPQIHHLKFCAAPIIGLSGRMWLLLSPWVLLAVAVLTKMTGQI